MLTSQFGGILYDKRDFWYTNCVLVCIQSWYHGGLLLQMHYSTLVGATALADVIAQVMS